MTITPLMMVLFGFACFAIGFSKAGFGGALGFFVTPLLAIVLPLPTVVGIILPVLMLGDVFTVAIYWRKWEARLSLVMLAGAVVGVTAATLVLVNTPPDVLRKGLAGFVLLFVVYRLLEKRILAAVAYRPHTWHGVLAGSVGGFTSALANAGGPPVTVYLLLQNLEPTLFVATAGLFFAVLNWIKVPFFIYGNVINFNLLRQLAWLLIFVPLGVYVGRKVVRVMNKTVFDNLVLIFLVVASILLLI